MEKKTFTHFRPVGSDQEKGLRDLIANLPEVKTMVEVGSAYGESAVIFAESIDEVICVDSWQNDRESIFDEKVKDIPNIVKVKKGSTEAVKDIKSVDFVYIDASHSYENVKRDIKLWAPKCRRAIGGHDYSIEFAGVVLAVAEELTGFDEKQRCIAPELFKDTSWLCLL